MVVHLTAVGRVQAQRQLQAIRSGERFVGIFVEREHQGHLVKLYQSTFGWSILRPDSPTFNDFDCSWISFFPTEEEALDVAATFYSWGLAE